jgi:hypothetical protein
MTNMQLNASTLRDPPIRIGIALEYDKEPTREVEPSDQRKHDNHKEYSKEKLAPAAVDGKPG